MTRSVFYMLCMICCAIYLAEPATANRLPKALLLTGKGDVADKTAHYPPWQHEFQNEIVVNILKDVVSIDTTQDLSVLNNNNLKQYELIISNSIFLHPTREQLAAVYKFVTEGKSFITLHCGILSFLNWDKYEEFMGGIFIGGPSSDPSEFRVYTTNSEFWGYNYVFRNNPEHPVSKVVDDFDTKDELYYFQPGKKEFHVIARAENHPVMWWHPVGKGKVMSLTLGHDAAAKASFGYQQLLINGVRWLAGYPLMKAWRSQPVSNRTLRHPAFLSLHSITEFDNKENINYTISQDIASDIGNSSVNKNSNLQLNLTGKSGLGKLLIKASAGSGLSVEKPVEFMVVQDGEGNIASYHDNNIQVSSRENSSDLFRPENLIDDDSTTRWSSSAVDSAWVLIDLKKTYPLKLIRLHWEASYAKKFQLLGSLDNKTWKKIHQEDNGDGQHDNLSLTTEAYRYIKLLCTQKAPGKWGYSLYEIQLFTE